MGMEFMRFNCAKGKCIRFLQPLAKLKGMQPKRGIKLHPYQSQDKYIMFPFFFIMPGRLLLF